MSLKLNSSGGGSVLLQEPSTASNRTLTLPDADGTVNTSGAVNQVPAGSASAPAITTSGDTNTGIFFPAADTIAFAEGGVEAMRLDSAGNVGIGTTSPSAKLDVQVTNNANARVKTTSTGYALLDLDSASSNQAIVRLLANGVEQSRIYSPANTDASTLSFATGSAGTERARIDSSGNFLFNSGYGSVATAYGCRAWVNFNSTGTVSIYGSGNCSSITDNGVGNFTFNFATAMPNTNYSVVTGPTQSSSNTNGGVINVFLSATNTYSAPLVGSFRFVNYHAANSALGDSTYNCLAVFR
jgi:hypothetical protein